MQIIRRLSDTRFRQFAPGARCPVRLGMNAENAATDPDLSNSGLHPQIRKDICRKLLAILFPNPPSTRLSRLVVLGGLECGVPGASAKT